LYFWLLRFFLDETTQHALNRGVRLIELLKQQQYRPLAVKLQIVVIYAGMRGFLDSLTVQNIGVFKTFLLESIISTQFSIDVNSKLNNCLIDNFLESVFLKFNNSLV
jgi:F0F1-type ATP synthase alpha subunit